MKNLVFLLSYKIDTLKFQHFSKLFEKEGALLSDDPKQDYDIVIAPPGEDIHPFLYGQKKLDKTQPNYIRDLAENSFLRNVPRNKPKVGIGRGAQLLNVIYGGSLYQHVTGHVAPHILHDYVTGTDILVNSYHHQEMILPSHAWVAAAASSADRKVTPDGTEMYDYSTNMIKGYYYDTEVGFLEDENVLLFQPDPTLQLNSIAQANTWDYFKDLLDEWLIPEMNKRNKKPAKVA